MKLYRGYHGVYRALKVYGVFKAYGVDGFTELIGLHGLWLYGP